MSLRVVQSTPVWLPRTQTWMYEHLRRLPGGIESHVVCDRTQNLDQFEVPRLHRPSPLGRLADGGLRFVGLRRSPGLLGSVARRIGARVLHSHFGHVGWRDRDAARRARLRHVVTFYGQDLGYLPRLEPRWRPRYAEMFRGVDRVLCEGPHMAQGIAELGCPRDKVKVHHLGVDLDALAFRPRRWDGRPPLRVLLAGSFTEKKGFPDAVEALAKLGAGVEATLVGDADGKPRNQAEKRRILEAIGRTGLRVRRLGYQSHRRLLEEAYAHHVFLSPSVTASDGDTEGGVPVTILEMAATGMPVVITRHADIAHALPCALLGAERDPEGLARHLRFLADHPDRWGPLAEEARCRLEAHYDVSRQAERLAAIYAEVAGVDPRRAVGAVA
ncbi:MAG: glycosyltransferase [Planctomycetota bacterium]